MDIIEYALNMEKDGKVFYEKAAVSTSNPDLKEILLTLAEEERIHYEFFSRLKKDSTDLTAGRILTESSSLDKIKNVFAALSNNKEGVEQAHDAVSLWTQALRLEEKAVRLYRDASGKETDGEKKKLLVLIAGEEENHVQMINVVLMYLKQPAAFADSAQFKNFMSLEGR